MNKNANAFVRGLMQNTTVSVETVFRALCTGMDEVNALNFLASFMMPSQQFAKTAVIKGTLRTLESVDLLHGSAKYSYDEPQYYKSEEAAVNDSWPRRDTPDEEFCYKGIHKSFNSMNLEDWPEGPDAEGNYVDPLNGAIGWVKPCK